MLRLVVQLLATSLAGRVSNINDRCKSGTIVLCDGCYKTLCSVLSARSCSGSTYCVNRQFTLEIVLYYFHFVCFHSLAFCPYDVTNTMRGSYLWPVTNAEYVITFPCVYGTVAGGHPARRNCSDRGVWIEEELSDCLTFSNSLLLNISNVCTFS